MDTNQGRENVSTLINFNEMDELTGLDHIFDISEKVVRESPTVFFLYYNFYMQSESIRIMIYSLLLYNLLL